MRTLIVFAPGRNDPTLQRQHALLDRRFGRICDHGLHLIEVIGDTVAGAHDYASALRQRYAITHDRFGAVLIGRDGEIRLRADNPVDPGNFPPILRAVPAIR